MTVPARLSQKTQPAHRCRKDTIVVAAGEAALPRATRIETYLGESLLAADEAAAEIGCAENAVGSSADELALVVERTKPMAARLGYRVAIGIATYGAAAPPRGSFEAPVPHVHSEPTRACCAILVPTMRYIEPECENALMQLEHRGYRVLRLRGCPSIDQGRNMLALTALEQGFEETLWVDADVAFEPDSVERLRSRQLPIVAGVYARKHPIGGLAVAPLPGAPPLLMGEGGEPVEVLYAAAGFLLVRREVYESIQQSFDLPLCGAGVPQRSVPFFMPMLEDWGGRMWYLGEDYAFCRRARLCGYKVMADTSIRLWHIGPYHYGYEDAVNELERLPSYLHTFETHESEGKRR